VGHDDGNHPAEARDLPALSSLQIVAQHFDGSACGAPQLLYTVADPQITEYTTFAIAPVSAIDGKGNGMVVFTTPGIVQMATFDANTGTWSAASNVASSGFGSVAVSLRLDATGNAFLLENNPASLAGGTMEAVQVRRYDAGTQTWAAPGLGFGRANGQTVLMELDRNGLPMIVWSANGAILASRYH
jgi:hypothetical protein